MNINSLDVLVIGAGQAGLALAFYLKDTPLHYAVLESNGRVGDSWRMRYDSLTLFTPRAFSALPGLALPGDPDGYATRDEFADYLERYARHFALPVHLNTRIAKLEQTDGGFRATTDSGNVILSRVVVLATGPFQKSFIPDVARQSGAGVVQFTADTYRNAAQIPPGNVLVVGDGATGRDIASELSAAHTVLLATGHPRRLLPEQVLGRSIWWWLDKLGILYVPGDTPVGRYMRKADPFPARGRRNQQLIAKGVRLVPRLAAAEGDRVTFANSETARIHTIIWATGYHDDSDWVMIPEVKDARGNFVQKQGISPVPNLYFIGRSWQRSRSSALIMGAGEDARWIKEQIVHTLLSSQP